jgi:hypothetical protein
MHIGYKAKRKETTKKTKTRVGGYIHIHIYSSLHKSIMGFSPPDAEFVIHIKVDLGEIGWGGMNWTDLTQDRDQLRALVNMVMNLGVAEIVVKFLSCAQLAASQEGLSSMELGVGGIKEFLLGNYAIKLQHFLN